MSVKRFALFSGDDNPGGGWDDFDSSHDTLEEAQIEGLKTHPTYWWHIVDMQTGEQVDCAWRREQEKKRKKREAKNGI